MTTDLDELSFERARRGAFGVPARFLDSVGSTNDVALEWARDGAPEGALVVAERQDAGRGRWGRTWSSEPGRSLTFSVVLRPDPDVLGLISTAAGIACCRALEGTGIASGLKWPNDVVVGDRKIAGILVESRTGAAAVAVAGVGINHGWTSQEVPPEIAERATSVAMEVQHPPPRAALMAAVLAELESGYSSLKANRAELLQEAADRSVILGRVVEVRGADGAIRHGCALRLDETGALIVDVDGTPTRFDSAEISRLRAG